MTAGFQITLSNINAQAGVVAQGVRQALQAANIYQTWFLTVGAAGVEALGMTTADAAVLGSAAADLNDLWTIYNGGTSVHLTGTYQYTQFAKQLTAYN